MAKTQIFTAFRAAIQEPKRISLI